MLNALGLIDAAIKAREDRAFVVGVDDVRIARIREDVAALSAADGIPITAIDKATVAARADAHRRVVLLRAVDAIQKIVVSSDVIELRGGLIVLRRPVFATVHGNGGAAVVAIDHAIRVVGIDPKSVMIAMGRVEAFEGFARIDGAVEASVRDVDLVRIFRVSPDMREVPGALAEAMVVVDERPFAAAVVASIEAPFLGFDESIDDIRVGAGNRDADAAERTFRESVAFDWLPRRAVVAGTVEAVFRAATIERPRRAIAFPHRGKENVRILRIEDDIDAAGAVVEVEDFFPGFSAVARAENAALGIGTVGVP